MRLQISWWRLGLKEDSQQVLTLKRVLIWQCRSLYLNTGGDASANEVPREPCLGYAANGDQLQLAYELDIKAFIWRSLV